MYALSEDIALAFNEQIKANNREFSVKIEFTAPTERELTGTTIQSISVDEVVNSTDTLTLGCACSNKIVVDLIGPPTDIVYENAEFIAYVGLKIGDECEYVPLGKFYVTDTETANDFKTLKITAYDGFCKMTDVYDSRIDVEVDTEVTGVTLQALYNDLKEQLLEVCKITLKDEMLPEYPLTTFRVENITFQQAIGYVAGCLGGFARFDREGKLEIATYKESGVNISRDLQYMSGFKKTTAEPLSVKSMVTGTKETPIECGEGGIGVDINFENPYITQAMADVIWKSYYGLTYTPSQVKWRGNPCIQAGDIVSVPDKDEIYHTVLVMSQNIKIGGGLNSTIECKGKSETTANFSSGFESTSQKIDRVYSTLEQAIVDATKAITGNSGGYVVVRDSKDPNGNVDGYPDEILVMDHADIDQAQNVWRWNKEGLAHSSNGYEGSYGDFAITADGKLNANMITTGSLNANLVRIVDDKGNSIYMENGIINFALDGTPLSMKLGNVDDIYQLAIFSNGQRIAYFSQNSFEIENITGGKIRFQDFGFIPRSSGNLTFTKLK